MKNKSISSQFFNETEEENLLQIPIFLKNDS